MVGLTNFSNKYFTVYKYSVYCIYKQFILWFFMLTNINISNLSILKYSDLKIKSGMTAITGETGSGKSIFLQALNLSLGHRHDSSIIRDNKKPAVITASFEIEKLKNIIEWLKDNDLIDDMNCILRRVIYSNGKSKSYINDYPVTLKKLKKLGEKLINIHGQNSHNDILCKEKQLYFVDHFANNKDILKSFQYYYSKLNEIEKDILIKLEIKKNNDSKKELLQFQLLELKELSLKKSDYEHFEKQYNSLSNADILSDTLYQVTSNINSESDGIVKTLQQLKKKLCEIMHLNNSVQNSISMLEDSIINLQEIDNELSSQAQNIVSDNTLLQELENKISKIISLSRKYNTTPNTLYNKIEDIETELYRLENCDEEISHLEQKKMALKKIVNEKADLLTERRKKSLLLFSKEINKKLKHVNLENAIFKVDITSKKAISESGNDCISFLMTTNDKSNFTDLKSISGGELSRVALVIMATCASKFKMPTIVFDEIDTGISGKTARKVGNLLHQIGTETQLICVTHLPQVASFADTQLFVEKHSDNYINVKTHIIELSKEERINEVARLLGGEYVTKASKANAIELLAHQIN
ncbi:DNA repair protein RecN [Paraphotobacterium marinum]|uniref:DNA repair protein RecN n=2 Tax=Paraphotobacterium marinum TaxID=1755811 RepID=A0A220VDW2_9GAMM|nr:DNA repair protein RecN [Paraphotobacterium marinum]